METFENNLALLFKDQRTATTREVAEALLLPFTNHARRAIEARARRHGLQVTFLGWNTWANI